LNLHSAFDLQTPPATFGRVLLVRSIDCNPENTNFAPKSSYRAFGLILLGLLCIATASTKRRPGDGWSHVASFEVSEL
jgi:hypothetical protein